MRMGEKTVWGWAEIDRERARKERASAMALAVGLHKLLQGFEMEVGIRTTKGPNFNDMPICTFHASLPFSSSISFRL